MTIQIQHPMIFFVTTPRKKQGKKNSERHGTVIESGRTMCRRAGANYCYLREIEHVVYHVRVFLFI